MRKTTLALAMALFATPLAAMDLKQEMLSCSALTDGIKRLECFDRLASNEQKDADEQAAAQLGEGGSTSGHWDVKISKSKIDDSTQVVLTAEANEAVPGRFNRTARPSLVLRCLENTTAAFVHFDGLHMADIQGYGRVTFRVDKQKAFTRNMDVSTNNKALGLWGGGSAIPFAKQLFGGSTLLVQATPFSDSPVTFSLNIEGLEEAIKPLRSACNW